MIEAGLEFSGAIDHVVSTLTELPGSLRPIYFSREEKLESDAGQIADSQRFSAFVAKSNSGFFLLGPRVTYSLRSAMGKPVICDCFLDVPPEDAESFLRHMSRAMPIFGFSCMPGERELRNRVTIQQGINKIENWMGRDSQKYVPGLYWLTLLPEELARKHGISLAALSAVARHHMELENAQHLFRFYDRPEEWEKTSAVTDLSASLPGVFDIEKVKPQLIAAKNFLDLNELLREWR